MVGICLMTIPYRRGSNRCFIDPHIKALLTAKAARRALSAKKEFSKVLEMLEGEELLGTRYNAMLTGTTNETKDWSLGR